MRKYIVIIASDSGDIDDETVETKEEAIEILNERDPDRGIIITIDGDCFFAVEIERHT